MSDEEKVLSDLKDIVEYFMRLYREEEDHHIYDQHYDRMVVVSNACNLIEELLKDQEPMVLTLEQEPIKVERHMEETEWNVCGNCGSHVIHKWAYCPYCGKRLKWDA